MGEGGSLTAALWHYAKTVSADTTRTTPLDIDCNRCATTVVAVEFVFSSVSIDGRTLPTGRNIVVRLPCAKRSTPPPPVPPLPQPNPFERWRWWRRWQAGWTVDSSRLASRWLTRRRGRGVGGRWLISRGWEPGYTKKLRPLEASKEQSLAAPSDPHSAICHTLPTRTLTPYSNAATLTSQQPPIVHCLTPNIFRPRWI